MKILIITPYIPYPLSEGGKISQFAIIDKLRNKVEISLFLDVVSREDEKNVNVLKSLWTNVSFFTLKSYNAPSRVLSVKQTVKKNLTNSYRYLRSLIKSNHTTGLEHKYRYLSNFASTKNEFFVKELHKVIKSNKFDIVQIELIRYLDVVLALPDNIKKIFVHHELRFARFLSEVSADGQDNDLYNKYLCEFIKFQEILLLQKYDGIFIFSDVDKLKLCDNGINENKLFVSPFPVLDNEFVTEFMLDNGIDKLTFVGGESHKPNKDAIDWYIEKIGKMVFEKHKLVLHIIGKWEKETKNKYKDTEYVKFSGYVDDLKEYCKNSIMLVPIRAGSGIRTKILYSMAQGIPVISTSLGCEGIDVKHGVDLLIANSPEEFAYSISLLQKDDNLRNQIRKSAWNKMRDNYTQDNVVAKRIEFYNKILKK